MPAMNYAYRLGLLAALLGGAVVRAEGTPKIQFDRTNYDFGETSLVESVTGTFTYQNTGDAVLELQKPKPSCGCTVASITSEKLRPGEKGELVFTIRLGAGIHQRLSKSIVVSSNDPQDPDVELGIQVQTKSVLTAEPPSIGFGALRPGTTTNASVVIRRNDGKKLTITKVDTSSDLITARIEPVVDADPEVARLQVRFKPAGLPRHFSEQIRLHTDDSVGAVLAVFVSAQLVGDIKLEPESLSWGMPDPNNSQPAKCATPTGVCRDKDDASLLHRRVNSQPASLRVRYCDRGIG